MDTKALLRRMNWNSSFLGKLYNRYTEVTSFLFFRIVQVILLVYSVWRLVSYAFGDLYPLHPWPVNWLDPYTRLGLWPGLCSVSWWVVGLVIASILLIAGWATRRSVLFWAGVLQLFFTSFLAWV